MMEALRQDDQGPEPGRVLAGATLAVAARLGLTQQALAEILGVSTATVSRFAAGSPLRIGSAEARLAALLVRAWRSLDALVGADEEKARAWFEADNEHLGAPPVERVRSVQGLVDVVEYLDAMRGRL